MGTIPIWAVLLMFMLWKINKTLEKNGEQQESVPSFRRKSSFKPKLKARPRIVIKKRPAAKPHC